VSDAIPHSGPVVGSALGEGGVGWGRAPDLLGRTPDPTTGLVWVRAASRAAGVYPDSQGIGAEVEVQITAGDVGRVSPGAEERELTVEHGTTLRWCELEEVEQRCGETT
jgi:hypothetical protein